MRTPALICLVLALAGCAGDATEQAVVPTSISTTPPELELTRGVILISLDTLRADRLGTYGYDNDTSPFLDQLAAERGVVFERVVAQYPGTLISHMSMLTGLYPQEHGVLPPAAVLSPDVPLLAEMLSNEGVTTAGHTEGGFMDGDFGFARGFSSFTDTPYADDRDIERTFARGVDFLTEAGTDADEGRFFLFLHTYSIHDPYTPPPGHGVDSSVPLDPPPTGEVLRDANRGFVQVPDDVVHEYSDRYDASIRYVDSVLRDFFDRLESMELSDDTAVIITSDHGEAFREHGKLGHEQTYPEELQVPLVVIHPDLDRGYRVSMPAELVDVTPTVLELLGVELPPTELPMSGRSLLSSRDPRRLHAENADPTRNRGLLREDQEGWWMLVETEYLSDPDGTWLPLDHAFDVNAPADLEIVAFNGPKVVEVIVDGELAETIEVSGSWQSIRIDSPGRRRIHLATEGCNSPQRLGVGDDPRCLSLKLGGARARRLELFELTSDPGAQRDLSFKDSQRLRRMLSDLNDIEFIPRATAGDAELDPETRETLETLGYL